MLNQAAHVDLDFDEEEAAAPTEAPPPPPIHPPGLAHSAYPHDDIIQRLNRLETRLQICHKSIELRPWLTEEGTLERELLERSKIFERKEKVSLSVREKECEEITQLLRASFTLAPLVALVLDVYNSFYIKDQRQPHVLRAREEQMKSENDEKRREEEEEEAGLREIARMMPYLKDEQLGREYEEFKIRINALVAKATKVPV
ncbi:hypothetical protein IEQ34_009625 [Dendrobium chrysotoxum]|uniref:Uncharacterized protein n=1 Tax=Dendrobium chrysotoxum TaxID=161865 RepID=A0AAV7H3D4_DENCH|nr:hypothetical protein IEQ34_009625 [Dendrobium chrysotoxum]